MLCFLFITPLAAISGWLCLRGAQDHLRLHSRLEAVGLIALTIALFTIYVLWTLVSAASRRAGIWGAAAQSSQARGLVNGSGASLPASASASASAWVGAIPSISWRSGFRAQPRSRKATSQV